MLQNSVLIRHNKFCVDFLFSTNFNLLVMFSHCFSPSTGKVPFIHVGNQVVSELGPIVQFVKAKVIKKILNGFDPSYS